MNKTHANGERRRSELSELRRELRDKQSYLSDDSERLWADISRWLLESYDIPVGSLRTMVRGELAELQEDPQHKLYDHPDVDDGEAAFPDACKGCPHYGVQCPVLARHVSKQTLERIFDEAEDDDELQGRLSSFAAKHHCHVIQTTISEWEDGYAAFLSEGEMLRMRLNADIKGIDLEELGPDIGRALSDDEDAPSDSPTTVPDTGSSEADLVPDSTLGAEGPPDEVADRVAAVTQSLMAEEEEGDA